MPSTPEREAIFAPLLKSFFERGLKCVYTAECCGKLWVGVEPAGKCKTCGQPVSNESREPAKPFCP
jgi:hypothetical protein